MTHRLSRLPLRADEDIVAARLTARRLAERVGLAPREQTRLATAVSEIARNAHAHGGGGEIEFFVDAPLRPQWLSAAISDSGPGIADLDAILRGERVFAPGFGTGLLSARRLVDRFEVTPLVPRGTRVLLTQNLPRDGLDAAARARVPPLAAALPADAAQPVDAIAVFHEQNRELIASLDEVRERQDEAVRLTRELDETNRGVVALYSELEEQADQLRKASELKTRFLSHLSHEFRTPLNSILALSRLLIDQVDGGLNAEQERQVGYIRRAAQGLLELVNDLLDLAKVEAGRFEVKPVELGVDDLFAGLRGSLRPLLSNPDVDLVFDDASALPALFSDEAKLAQILRNYISNALKFTERGRVQVSARTEGPGHVVFAVQDSGIGIPEASHGLIFEEFTQVEGRLQAGGTGLGLALSKRLATLLGGKVWFISSEGAGSTFFLRVPIRWGEATPHGPEAAAGDAPLALVIDDDETFRYVVRHIAQDDGFTVVEAANGTEGLEQVARQRPDLVILDLQMPGLDGYEVLARLAADAATRAVPVIVCTSQLLSLDRKRLLAPAYAVVPKHDISRQGLALLMRHALARSRGEP